MLSGVKSIFHPKKQYFDSMKNVDMALTPSSIVPKEVLEVRNMF